APAILAQSFHAFDNGTLLELAAIFLLHDQLPQRFGDNANFVNRRAALIASVPTIFTPFAASELRPALGRWKSNFGQILARVLDQVGAFRANCAHESLRNK